LQILPANMVMSPLPPNIIIVESIKSAECPALFSLFQWEKSLYVEHLEECQRHVVSSTRIVLEYYDNLVSTTNLNPKSACHLILIWNRILQILWVDWIRFADKMCDGILQIFWMMMKPPLTRWRSVSLTLYFRPRVGF
jgi:hypothetical protein